MTANRIQNSRRAFFLHGGAALGAGVATGAAASVLTGEAPTTPDDQLKQLRQQLDSAAAREAIRKLHRAFTTRMQTRSYEGAAELFDERGRLDLSGETATGPLAILELFASQYAQQKAAVLHAAYRQAALQQEDSIILGEDLSQATATFHIEVELCTPLHDDCTAAQMARLQGHMADRSWQSGRIDASYAKRQGDWKITSLRYLPA